MCWSLSACNTSRLLFLRDIVGANRLIFRPYNRSAQLMYKSAFYPFRQFCYRLPAPKGWKARLALEEPEQRNSIRNERYSRRIFRMCYHVASSIPIHVNENIEAQSCSMTNVAPRWTIPSALVPLFGEFLNWCTDRPILRNPVPGFRASRNELVLHSFTQPRRGQNFNRVLKASDKL